MMLTYLGIIAMQFLGTPYIYGGNNPLTGLDCSGFIQIPLKTVKIIKDDKDRSAQMIYNYIIKSKKYENKLAADSILFYGNSKDKITHVALALNENLMIEAGNGSRHCKTRKEAARRDARVRIIPIKKNYIASLFVPYNLE